MRPLIRYPIAAALTIIAFLFAPVAAAAASAPTVADVETGLIALFPLVILIASLLLKPDAVEEVKQLLPAVVGLIVSVLYFVVNQWPEFGATLLVEVGALIALAQKLYDPVSALVKLLTSGRSLNRVTGPGLIGPVDSDERGLNVS